LASLVCLFSGCNRPPEESLEGVPVADEAPAYGDLLVEGSIGDASNLISILSLDSASQGISSLVFDGLVKYDKNLDIVGSLARSWDISDDGLVITFHLRHDVTWHDGEPFTAHDVLYTYNVTIDPKTPTAYAGDFLRVSRVEVIDDHTFRITYNEPFAPPCPAGAPQSSPVTSWKDRTSRPALLEDVPWAPVLSSSKSG